MIAKLPHWGTGWVLQNNNLVKKNKTLNFISNTAVEIPNFTIKHLDNDRLFNDKIWRRYVLEVPLFRGHFPVGASPL